MLTELRSQMTTIMWILVVAFLITIVLSWGMGGFKERSAAGIVGELNQKEINFDDFQNYVQRQIDSEQRKTEGELDQNKVKRIREDAWDKYVESYLKAEEAKRLKLKASDQEIVYIVENQPPPEIQQAPRFQKDGRFDPSEYQNFLRTPQASQLLIGLEESVRNFLIESKLYFQVIQSVDLKEEDILDKYNKDHVSGKYRFIAVLFDDMNVDSTELSDEMTRKYYRMFPEKFVQRPQRQFAYVKFSLTPSEQDSTEVRKEVENIMAELRSGADFEKLAKENSQDKSSADEGGDMGWFPRGRYPTAFDDIAFNSEIGELIGPIETRQGFHIVKVEGKRKAENGEDEIQARQILFKVEPSSDTRDEIYNRAYNFSQEVAERGFDPVSTEMGLEVDTTKEFSEAGYIAGLGRMRMAAEFCFNNPVGTASSVFNVPDGYVVFKVIKAVEEGARPYEDVQSSARKQLERIMQKHKAWDLAAELRSKIDNVYDMTAAAAETGLPVHISADTVNASSPLPDNLPADDDFISSVFRLEEGELSQLIEGKKGYYIACLEAKRGFDSNEYSALHQSIYQELASQKQDAAARNWIRELRIAANMKDYRYKYYRDF